jgi:hypothetical protein
LAEEINACFASLNFPHEVAPQLLEDPESPRTSLGTSTCLGDFRIRRELGRGGMGVVHEAEQLSLGRMSL